MGSRSFADYGIDPVGLSSEENEQVADLIEQNSDLLNEVRIPRLNASPCKLPFLFAERPCLGPREKQHAVLHRGCAAHHVQVIGVCVAAWHARSYPDQARAIAAELWQMVAGLARTSTACKWTVFDIFGSRTAGRLHRRVLGYFPLSCDLQVRELRSRLAQTSTADTAGTPPRKAAAPRSPGSDGATPQQVCGREVMQPVWEVPIQPVGRS